MEADPLSAGTYWTGGVYGGLIAVSKTIDGGKSWTRYVIGSSSGMVYALAVDPTNPSIVYAGGFENTLAAVYRTTDGGSSWTKLTATGLAGTVRGIAIDPSTPATLYAATSEGGFKSANGGDTWSRVVPASYELNAVLVDPGDPQTVYFATEGGEVLRSEDGGASYESISAGLPGDTPIRCLEIHPGLHLFAGTEDASAFRRGIQTGMEEAPAARIGHPGLAVAPNPTGGPTTVFYDLRSPSHVTLGIYDLQGRLVDSLVDGFRDAGEHQAVWNPGDAPAGVYLFRLQAGCSTPETGRLILLD